MPRAAIKYAGFGVVLLVIVVEATLRWGVGLGQPPLARLDPMTEYELVPSATYRRWGNTIAINANGMRAAEHPALPDEGEERLLLIGDSVVYGGHFLGQSEIISEQLNGVLSGCRLRVLPVAVSSWGPVNQAAFLQKYGTFGARAAGIVVSAHDLYDVPNTVSDILPYRTAPSVTAIGDLLQAVLERSARASGAPEDTQPFEVKVERSLAALDRMVAILGEQSVRPVLIYHPTVSERDGQHSAEHAQFLAWSQARNIEFFDLGTMEIGPDDYRDDIHPTAVGANRIAQALAPVMVEQLASCSIN